MPLKVSRFDVVLFAIPIVSGTIGLGRSQWQQAEVVFKRLNIYQEQP